LNYSTRFESFFIGSLFNEGGNVSANRAKKIKDPGGATNWGISLRFLKSCDIKIADINCDGVIDGKDILVLSTEQAKNLYARYFWIPYYEDIIHMETAFRLWDFGINAGVKTAVRIYQLSVNQLLKMQALKPDGIFGIKCLTVSNTLNYKSALTISETVESLFEQNIEAYYRSLKKTNFLSGWITRLKRNLSDILALVKKKQGK